MDKVPSVSKSIKTSLITAVRKGYFKDVKDLVQSYGVSYSEAWSDGYVLLVEAIEHRRAKIAKLLIREGAKVNSFDEEDSDTPLHLAVRNGDIKLVKILLQKGANVHATNICGYTPLHLAVTNYNTKIINMLLDRGADLRVKTTNGYTPLHCAVDRYKEEIVTLLLKRNVNVNVKATDGTTPLHIAAERGFIQIIKVLLDHGADIHSACISTWREGYMPIHFSSQQGSKEAVRLFLSKGADVNANTKENLTPLHFAVKAGHETVVKLLLEHGGKVDAQNNYGKTILQLAVENGYSTIVKDILKYRPDINNPSNRSSLKTALRGSKGSDKKIVEDLLQYGFIIKPEDVDNSELLHNAVAKGTLKIVKNLLKYGADINLKDKRGHTPLYYAIENCHAEITKLLLTNGANIKDSPELLHTAVAKGSLKTVKDLLKYGADVNVKDERGHTPIYYVVKNFHAEITKLLLTNGANIKDSPELLHAAVAKGSLKIVRDLLKYGADVNIKDERGHTPIYYVVEKFNIEITNLLLTNGADIKDCPELLHTAVEAGSLEIVEDLLKRGADVNMMDLDFNSKHRVSDTPLHRAAENMQEDVVKLLLNYGANVNAKDDWENTPIVFAVHNSDAKITKLLLNNGADIKESPELLQIAATKGCLEIVKDLLKYDPDVNYSDKDGRTALYLTVLNNDLSESESSSPAIIDIHDREEIVELLLSKGANVTLKTKNSVTVLHTAAGNGYTKIVEILLKFGADVDCRDKYGRTALYTAIKGGHAEVVNALLEYGSDINVTSKKNHTPLEYAMLGASLTYDEYDANYGYDNYDYDHGYNNFYDYDFDFDYDSDDYGYDDNYDNFNYKYDFYDSDESNLSVDDYHIHDDGGSDSDDNIRVFASRGKIVELLKQYIVKLKAAGLYVCKKHLQSIGTDFRLSAFGEGCEKEIQIIKGKKIGNSCASFYDILTKNTHQLAIYAKNEDIVQTFKSADYKTEFPKYASMIEAKFRRGVERKELMELGNQFFYSLFERLPELPLPCIEKIFSYLSNNDLKVLHTCV